MSTVSPLKYVGVVGFLIFSQNIRADPVMVRHVQGSLHGFLVLKDLDDKILASGDMTQLVAGTRVSTVLSLHFKDGSLFEEQSIFSQRRTFQLLTYKQIQKGPAFKAPKTFSLDTSTGEVSIQFTDKDGEVKNITDKLTLPPDLANGILTTVLGDVDPRAETTLSMLVATPKPRLVKLKIPVAEQDSFSVGGSEAKANHYAVQIDLGGITGVAAKIIGKQPPPVHIWIAAGKAPVFLRLQGPLYEDGPVWQIELASPSWDGTPHTKQLISDTASSR
jgi:hypothetical protein